MLEQVSFFPTRAGAGFRVVYVALGIFSAWWFATTNYLIFNLLSGGLFLGCLVAFIKFQWYVRYGLFFDEEANSGYVSLSQGRVDRIIMLNEIAYVDVENRGTTLVISDNHRRTLKLEMVPRMDEVLEELYIYIERATPIEGNGAMGPARAEAH